VTPSTPTSFTLSGKEELPRIKKKGKCCLHSTVLLIVFHSYPKEEKEGAKFASVADQLPPRSRRSREDKEERPHVHVSALFNFFRMTLAEHCDAAG